jgi:hypothetical protein
VARQNRLNQAREKLQTSLKYICADIGFAAGLLHAFQQLTAPSVARIDDLVTLCCRSRLKSRSERFSRGLNGF